MTLTLEDRTRRTANLCSVCLRNIAFYRAGWGHNRDWIRSFFWLGTSAVYLDMAIIDWCKIFGDPHGKHYWAKTVTDQSRFFATLLQRLRLDEAGFNAYVETLRRPRDKFIAHLDEEDVMRLPRLRHARGSAAFLYDYFHTQDATPQYFREYPEESSTHMYEMWYRAATREYRLASERAR